MEVADDLSFESEGSALDLLQTKHHLTSTASLTDASEDLWRTIAVWTDGLRSGELALDETRFTLMTTASAPPGSAAAELRSESRDSSTALERLEATARTSENQANKPRYDRFLELAREQRARFVDSIVILDSERGVSDIEARLYFELRRAAEPDLVKPLSDRLWGWWIGRVLRHLTTQPRDPITAEELERTIDDLRDQFASDNLPIDVGVGDDDLGSLDVDDRQFVRQLQLIAASNKLLELAIRDYKRAYLQRSRWTNDGLVRPGELARYEGRLVDEWEHQEAFARQDLTDESPEEDQQASGRKLYEVMQNQPIWIRDKVRDQFVPRGSLHMLADELRIGWAPDFVRRLREVLEKSA
jgi:hypothetical protein